MGGAIARVSHAHNVKRIVVGRLLSYVMSSIQGISIGHFDSEAFSFQEETKNTQGRQKMCTLLQHLEDYQSDVNYAKLKTMALHL